jgi:hypothetical protein
VATATATPEKSCKIEVGAFPALRPSGDKLYVPGNHLFILYTDDRATQQIFRGGPGNRCSQAFPWRAIATFSGSAQDPNNPDIENLNNPFLQLVPAMQGKEACGKDFCLALQALRIHARCIQYLAWGPNSNTVASTLLNKCGIPRVKPNVRTPGWDYGDL